MSPTVSVVIPAYNHERFIQAAVDSVLTQTHEDLELIVVDDGSTDRTGAIVQAVRDSRLRYFHQENQDAYNTINRGLSLASGEFVAILNSDDVWARNRLDRLLAVQRESGAQCLFTDVSPIDDDGRPLDDVTFGWNLWHEKNRAFYFACKDLYTAFLKGNFMVTTSNLFLTREAVTRVGPFAPLRYLHDYDYIFRVLLACPGRVRYLESERLLFYRIHGNNTLSEAAISGREQDKHVIRTYLLAALPDAVRPVVAAGCDRLVELEQELAEVRKTLAIAPDPGVRQSLALLWRAVRRRLAR